MVARVRAGDGVRKVAEDFKVSVGTVSLWVARSAGQRLDRALFIDRKPGSAWNRTVAGMSLRLFADRDASTMQTGCCTPWKIRVATSG